MSTRYRSPKRFRSVDYVLPFLIIICVGIIAVLVFNLWRALFNSETTRAAYLYIEEGNAQMKTWGTSEFFDLSSDVLIMQGDEIRASADAKIIVEFFDGTLMRIAGGSDVGFESINDEAKDSEINVNLVDGRLWFNKVYKNTDATDITVKMDNVVVHSNNASIFEVENETDEVTRVFNVFENEGLSVDVLSEDGSSVIETENIGIGQEIIFTAAVLDRYWKFQSPTVLSGISDDFKILSWYEWNILEDQEPTVFEKYANEEGQGLIKVEPESVASGAPSEDGGGASDENSENADEGTVNPASENAGSSTDENPDEGTEPAETPEEPAPAQDLGPITTPTLTSVSGGTQTDENGFYHVSGNIATITGGISGAAKVQVNGYTLQRFNPGDKTWTYFANADYDLMKPGENIYEVHGIAPDGTLTETIIVKVYYQPVEVAPGPAVESAAESVQENLDGAGDGSGGDGGNVEEN